MTGFGGVYLWQGLFYNLANFDEDLSGWDTGSVTDTRSMFFSATSFDNGAQPLALDTRSVTDMSYMFREAIAFNQPLAFDVSSVTSMVNMFYGATSFDQPLTWDVSSVISSVASHGMRFMFDEARDGPAGPSVPTALSDCNKRAIHDSLSASTAWPYNWSSFPLCTG